MNICEPKINELNIIQIKLPTNEQKILLLKLTLFFNNAEIFQIFVRYDFVKYYFTTLQSML